MNENTLRAATALGSPRPQESEPPRDRSASASAVSWGAIVAGAAGAAALSLILLILGVGLGLSSVSPWTGQGVAPSTLGVSTILWITFTQLAASAMGGYLAGRLRTRWISTHTDEVYFRDTAHGFLAWAVATLLTAATLTSAIGAVVGTGAQAGASVAQGGATAAAAAVPAAAANAGSDGNASSAAYYIDVLFRRDAAAPAPADGSGPAADASGASAEAGRILRNAGKGPLTADDAKYLGQLVAQRTGLSQADAEKRVTDTVGRLQAKANEAETAARDAADKARKASAYASLWLFISLLSGAFVASLAATYGGRQRDLY